MPHAESPEAMEADSTSQQNLEAIFDDDDSSDEFTSSAPAATAPSAGPVQAAFTDSEVMRAFYQRLLPFRYLFQWLNHSAAPTNDFMHREFAFTLPNDAYLRYQSFRNADELRKQCMQMIPSRFEIGPVYSTNPRERKTLRKASMFRPLSKELVFDIDLTDYDGIRTCCTGAKICSRCWQWIPMAIKVVEAALRDDFGFKHILWVYSGRRGAHAWVCDKKAREMSDDRRKAIAGYLELLKGGDKGGKKVNLRRPLHPHVERSLDLLREHFKTDILQSQDPWESAEKYPDLLALLPDSTLNAALASKWESSPGRSSTQKWNDIKTEAESGVSAKLDQDALNDARQDIILEYTYPRLDAEVSKKLNHLLKSPFCVHPGTGRVCVPIDTRDNNVENFDPFDVPTVTELLSEIDEWDAKNSNVDAEGDSQMASTDASDASSSAKKVQDWEKTRLKPYVEYFRRFVNNLLNDEMKSVKREREDAEPMEY
ncbi:uncharacterized protein PV09_03620 [Verruconis gallopava]|uniref:DNA primase n=1 Tax=Verruconis gallopava TaxID=253628 RepID=A0A0D2B383_9PEZI|nr:uncharacterized protein PV09_03620 [Verruconis gallopava]KIW05764.1 hypothetical protein PV09_03620 [Verruconis gallopava]